MKFIKTNLKLIIGFIVGVILASGITVYATYTYFATDVKYIENKSVKQALDELYANKRDTSDETKTITVNGQQTLDKYYKNLNVDVTTDKIYTEQEYNNNYNNGYNDGRNSMPEIVFLGTFGYYADGSTVLTRYRYEENESIIKSVSRSSGSTDTESSLSITITFKTACKIKITTMESVRYDSFQDKEIKLNNSNISSSTFNVREDDVLSISRSNLPSPSTGGGAYTYLIEKISE